MQRLALFLFLTTILTAQAAKEVELTAEPHHQLVFENAQVRVFNVSVAPHTDTLMHWHHHDYMYVMLGASEVVNAVKGKDPVTTKLQDAQAGFIPGNFAHIVHNGSQPFHNLTIELRQDDKLRQSSYKWDATRGLEILQGGTREFLFVKDGIRATEYDLQPGGTAPVSDGPYLIVALSELELLQMEHNAPVGASDHIHLQPAEARWIPTPHRSTLIHSGPPVKFITLEFPKE